MYFLSRCKAGARYTFAKETFRSWQRTRAAVELEGEKGVARSFFRGDRARRPRPFLFLSVARGVFHSI